jgi:hypothetical protein
VQTVAEFITKLATGKPVGYKIGSKFTGKREYHWDSRSGVYSESLPLVGYDEMLLQSVLLWRPKCKRKQTKLSAS